MSADPKRQLRVKARQLTELGKTPAWTVLSEALKAKEKRMARDLTLRLLDPTQELPLTQRQADLDIGFVRGMRYVLAVVAGAESKLRELEAELTSEEPDDEEDLWSGYRPS